ncbi:MAG: carboxypeptidase regulatory-like domain-containing protein [Acidobacteria bacterium]|nr:carboxypeptidase regulatory-like domain-containing protein [Acidobacteriota bacterium]
MQRLAIGLMLVLAGVFVPARAEEKKTSPRQAFEAANAVFTGRVGRVGAGAARLRNVDLNSGAIFDDTRLQTAEVTIEKMFRRADAFGLTAGETLTIYPPKDCRADFAAGEERLFYVRYDRETYSWVLADCYRSRPVAEAVDDLHFLEKLPGALDRTRVSGRVMQAEAAGGKLVYRPVAGVGIVASVVDYGTNPATERKFSAVTDADGFYEIYDLPPGRPYVSIENPPADRTLTSEEFGAPAASDPAEKTSRGVNFLFSAGFSYIKGTVADENGAPVPNVRVELVPAVADAPATDLPAVQTGPDGRYAFKIPAEINRGKYRVLANNETERLARPPFPPTFYPRSTAAAGARIVDAENGRTLENVDIAFPARLAEKTIAGRVAFRDGTPVTGGKVVFTGTIREITTDNGDFTSRFFYPSNGDINAGKYAFEAVESRAGRVQAELVFRRAELETCLKRKLALPDGRKYVLVTSKPAPVTVGPNGAAADLRFLIPPCRPAPAAEADRYWQTVEDFPLGRQFTRYGKRLPPQLPRFIESSEKREAPAESSTGDDESPRLDLAQAELAFAGTVVEELGADYDFLKNDYQLPRWIAKNVRLVRVDKLFKPAEIYGVEPGDMLLVDTGFKKGEAGIFLAAPRDYTYSDVWNQYQSRYTKPLDRMQSYVRSFEAPVGPNRRRVSGYVRLNRYDRANAGAPREAALEPMSGATVVLTPLTATGERLDTGGAKALRVATDARGFYEFDRLAPGKYWLYALTPGYHGEGFAEFGAVDYDDRRIGVVVDLGGQREASVDFETVYNGKIRGRVTDENGKPVAQAMIGLFDAATGRPFATGERIFTDPDGKYEIENLPDGKYLVAVVNPERVNFRTPFVPTFYPNATERGRATPVEMSRSLRKDGIDITVSARLPEKTLSGTVEAPAGAEVFLTFDGVWEFVPLKIDEAVSFYEYNTRPFETRVENNRFSVALPAGTRGKLQAYALIPAEKAAACLKDQSVPKADAGGRVKIFSRPVDVALDRDAAGLKLSFLVPPDCF